MHPPRLFLSTTTVLALTSMVARPRVVVMRNGVVRWSHHAPALHATTSTTLRAHSTSSLAVEEEREEEIMTSQDTMEELVGLFKRSNKVTVISGAGLSTESGIPDYRGPNGSYSKGHKPMVHDEFMRSAYQRARYWARSMVGFERFGKALPNRGHEALVHLQQLIPQLNIITQNVDGLHQKAGSKEVIDLHGRIDTVICMDCHYKTTRRSHQQKLLALNRGWIDNNLGTRKQYTQLADGDVGLVDVDFDAYTVPVCDRCGGTLKPDVVFFGDNVPSSRVQKAFEWVRESNLVVAVGTSLMVYSGYRFALAARDLGIPIATVNYGSMTRVEKNKIPHVKVEGKCGEVLPQIVQKLRDR